MGPQASQRPLSLRFEPLFSRIKGGPQAPLAPPPSEAPLISSHQEIWLPCSSPACPPILGPNLAPRHPCPDAIVGQCAGVCQSHQPRHHWHRPRLSRQTAMLPSPIPMPITMTHDPCPCPSQVFAAIQSCLSLASGCLLPANSGQHRNRCNVHYREALALLSLPSVCPIVSSRLASPRKSLFSPNS